MNDKIGKHDDVGMNDKIREHDNIVINDNVTIKSIHQP